MHALQRGEWAFLPFRVGEKRKKTKTYSLCALGEWIKNISFDYSYYYDYGI